MIRNMLVATLATLALASAAHAQPAPAGAPDTKEFITRAAQSDEFERQAGRLAEHRARNPMIRRFAHQMVEAHTKTTIALKKAIHRAGMPVPPPPQLSPEQQQMMDQLRHASPGDFGRTYITQQIQAHQQALSLMQAYAQNGQPGPIRDAARKTVPIVQHHLGMANRIQMRMH